MKKFSISSKIVFSVFSGLAACALAVGALVSSPMVAAAAGGTTSGGTKGAALQTVYQHELKVLDRQQGQLDKANALLSKIQGKGADVAALSTALDAFKSQVASAQASHDAAGAILSTHAGFDAAGVVTDATVARQTVQNARQDLRAAEATLKQGISQFRAAVIAFRQAHKPASK